MATPIVGLSGPFTRTALAHCPRCNVRVQASFPWPHWRHVRRGFFGVLGGVLAASPIVMSDVYGMLPAALVFVTALGPLNALVRIQPTCLTCGGVVLAVQVKAAHFHD